MSPQHPRTSLRQSTSAAPVSSGSQTITQPSNPTLRLRAEDTSTNTASTSRSNRRHIQWDDSVIDNEGMGKKSSKVCCIYHAPHEPGDSESDSSSSSSDDDSEGEDLSRAQRAGGGKGKGRGKHGEGDGCSGGGGGGEGAAKGKERKASPNAYERQPKTQSKKER